MSKTELNKWELNEEQEQQKLIDQECQQFKKEHNEDSPTKDTQMQTVELIHTEVQTEEEVQKKMEVTPTKLHKKHKETKFAKTATKKNPVKKMSVLVECKLVANHHQQATTKLSPIQHEDNSKKELIASKLKHQILERVNDKGVTAKPSPEKKQEPQGQLEQQRERKKDNIFDLQEIKIIQKQLDQDKQRILELQLERLVGRKNELVPAHVNHEDEKTREDEQQQEERERELQKEQEREQQKELELEQQKLRDREVEKQKERELQKSREQEQQKEREQQEERERKQREQRKREKETAEKEQSKQKKKAEEQLQQEEPNIEEEAMRKLQEHLQRQQQRLQSQPQQQLPYVRLKKSPMQTSLIYPPIAPTTANQLSPAPSPTNIASPISKIGSNNNNSNNSTTTNTIIQTPLTPQSISSVGSNSNSSNTNNSTSSSNKRTTVNNCSPQTYSKSFNSLISRTSARRVSKFRTSSQLYTTRSWEDQEFHCDNEFFLEEADELLADNPSLEIPKWKVVNIRRSPDSKGTEPLSDADFERRHEKDVRDEIERKKRDARYLREQQRSDTLRMRHNQDEVLVPLDPLPTSTFYPLPMDIEGIEFVTEVPVQAFGENVVNLQVQTDDFSLPWLDSATASTAIAKAKADALPVATLASKKLPTTAAEARHQEMNSSYVFLKRRKRLRRR